MNDLLTRLTRTLPGVGGKRGRETGGGEPARLAREVVRLHKGGRYLEAQEAAERLVGVQRARLGEGHSEYASALTNLALVLQSRGNLAAAELLLREALEVRREALGDRHPDTAASLGHLEALLSALGDRAEAAPP